jgi:hypothetical protein
MGKLRHYSHAPEISNIDEWYNEKFLKWTEGSPAIMPDGKIFEVTQNSLPQELRAYLDVDA